MQELFASLPTAVHVDFLLDTCMLFYLFEHQHEKALRSFCEENKVGITSFNVEEVLHHTHHVNHTVRERLRKEIKSGLLLHVVVIPVHPGNADLEKNFISAYDPALLQIIPDPSDAVLFVQAAKIGADVLTRDKHHLFTTQLENYAHEAGIRVLNNLIN